MSDFSTDLSAVGCSILSLVGKKHFLDIYSVSPPFCLITPESIKPAEEKRGVVLSVQ